MAENAATVEHRNLAVAASLKRRRRRTYWRVGPYSTEGAIALLDGRSREAKLMRRVRAELAAHCGGQPSPVQKALIERCARLTLALELLDERLQHGEIFSTHDHAFYLAWSNALTRTLARLGASGVAASPGPSLADYLSAKQQV